MPSLRKLKLVAMHMPEWEEVGRTLGIEQDVLDQCKKSNRSVLHLCGRAFPHISTCTCVLHVCLVLYGLMR